MPRSSRMAAASGRRAQPARPYRRAATARRRRLRRGVRRDRVGHLAGALVDVGQNTAGVERIVRSASARRGARPAAWRPAGSRRRLAEASVLGHRRRSPPRRLAQTRLGARSPDQVAKIAQSRSSRCRVGSTRPRMDHASSWCARTKCTSVDLAMLAGMVAQPIALCAKRHEARDAGRRSCRHELAGRSLRRTRSRRSSTRARWRVRLEVVRVVGGLGDRRVSA